MVRYERVPIPPAYLEQHCVDLTLGDAENWAALEAKAEELLLCVAQHNYDKRKISELR